MTPRRLKQTGPSAAPLTSWVSEGWVSEGWVSEGWVSEGWVSEG